MNYNPPTDLLQNKIILVTGAGDGIGREAALTYARHGATVILLGKTTKKLETVYDEILESGYPEPAIIPMDLKGASKQNYSDMAETIDSQFGRLDGLLHNAGTLGVLSPLLHISEHTWNDVMHINTTAPFLMTQALIPVLRKAEHGSVIFTSSGVSTQGKAFWGAYAVSKFAVLGLMETIADEYEQTNLRFNCINPGGTKTAMRARAYPGEDANTLATPKDIMPTYLYLMGDDSITVTGQNLHAQPKQPTAAQPQDLQQA